MKKYFIYLIILLIPINVYAEDITSSSTILVNDTKNAKITDNNENSYISINTDDVIKIESENIIDGLYIIYEMSSKEGVINANNKTLEVGKNGFLHEYLSLNELGSNNSLTLTYKEDVKIAEIYVLSEGALPEYVEVWNLPCEEADLLLFSTHSDDEQLFFLGLLPTYVAKGAYTQVVYYTNHYDNPKRLHEQLHGLYTVGVRNYPIIGIIPDAYSETLDGAIKNINKANLSVDDAVNFQVEMIRRFNPQVVVGHDEEGEYSHGQHILNTYTLKIALEKSNDSTYHEESYNTYGLWDTPKTYLHLYKENQIVMDYDTPLEYFNGKTAYEVSKEGYSKHNSQQWTWFTKWINGTNNSYTKATEIKTYSPLEFGLYRSLVGEDINKNDMFENLTLRKDIKEEVNEEKDNNNTNENKEETIINEEFIKKYKLEIALSLLAIIIILNLIIKRKKK